MLKEVQDSFRGFRLGQVRLSTTEYTRENYILFSYYYVYGFYITNYISIGWPFVRSNIFIVTLDLPDITKILVDMAKVVKI